MDALGPWLAAFLFGQAIEVPIYLLGLRGRRPRLPAAAALAIAFGATLLTHPVVWFVFPRLLPEPYCPYWMMGAAAEVFAVGTEALYLRAFGVRRAFLLSLLANAASCGIGLLSREILGWP